MIKAGMDIRVPFVFVGLFVSVPAFADVAPRDSCESAGTSCATAGPNASAAGVCKSKQCTRARPNGETITYDCLRCVATSPKPNPKKTDPPPTPDPTPKMDPPPTPDSTPKMDPPPTPDPTPKMDPPPTPDPTPAPEKTDSKNTSVDKAGCSVGMFSNEGLVGGGMFALGFAALARSRRRR